MKQVETLTLRRTGTFKNVRNRNACSFIPKNQLKIHCLLKMFKEKGDLEKKR